MVFNGEGSWDPAASPAAANPVIAAADRFGHAVIGLFGISPGVHDYIKRVIGVPGDHVACCNAHGQLTVNGVALSEKSYLYPGNHRHPGSASRCRPAWLWVMGDHRERFAGTPGVT